MIQSAGKRRLMRLKNAIHASTYIRGYPMPTLYIADAERDADMKNLSRKEAAKVLEDMKSKGEIPKAAVTQWKRNTALDMAIEALKYSEVPNSSDCISRQAAIDALRKLREEDIEDYGCEIPEGFNQDHLDRATFAIKQLPSIQPKRGRWHYSDGKPARIGLSFGVICDQCGTESEYCTNFCGECGADMRGEQDDSV